VGLASAPRAGAAGTVIQRAAVFLDLNGTLVLPLKQETLAELTPIDGAIEAVARLSDAGFVCPVVTVQSRIAKGLFTAAQFEEWFRDFVERLESLGARVVGPYVCPHRFKEPCACKKPNTLLYDRAARDHAIDPTRSFVIGDSPDDVRAATALGARGCLVRTGWAADPAVVDAAGANASFVAASIVEAVEWIIAGEFLARDGKKHGSAFLSVPREKPSNQR
jgi:histidinol-phosphate phosphatase family protein